MYKPGRKTVYECTEDIESFCSDQEMCMVIHKAHFENDHISAFCTYRKDSVENQKVLITIKNVDPIDGTLIYMIDYPSIKFSLPPHNFMTLCNHQQIYEDFSVPFLQKSSKLFRKRKTLHG